MEFLNRLITVHVLNDWGKMVIHLFIVLGLVLSFGVGNSWSQDLSIAMFYGKTPPWDELQAFNVVVVEPEHGFNPEKHRTSSSELFAYVSLGEVLSSRSFAQDIPGAWILGENTAWASKIVDQAQEEWATFVLTNIVEPLWRRGYRGFFLDTLDSYQLIQQDKPFLQAQQQGLIKVIRTIKQKYPNAKLIFNRGFEIIPKVHNHIFAVAAESLFQGWSPSHNKFVPVSHQDRGWLLGELLSVRKRYNLPILVIDYLPHERRIEARIVAEKIQALGFIPWVTTPDLHSLGVGSLEVIPRKVLLLFDSRKSPDLAHSDMHRFIDFPLQYLGLVPVHWDIRKGFPPAHIAGRYAGIVAWFSRLESPLDKQFHQWISRQVTQQVKVVFIESFGFSYQNDLLRPFDVESKASSHTFERIRVHSFDPMIGFEFQPIADRQHFFPFRNFGGPTLLQLAQGKIRVQDAVGLSWWGGYILSPFPIVNMPNGEDSRWVLDPIQFFQRALQVDHIPIPETTTRYGRRLLLAHVDGDGFPSRVEFNHSSEGLEYAGERLLDEILEKYAIPTTVSIIEGELSEEGLYPKLSKRLERTAQKIFSLPHVEIASHSYSHPFAWQPISNERVEKIQLPIPGYEFTPEQLPREIAGSVAYINQQLAPSQKKAKVFLWTGDCNPSAEALRLVSAAGLANMNGGDTFTTEDNNSLSAVAPLGIQKGNFFQVYAPNQNENIYTNEWTGPFYGYQQVIETFKLTDFPRRYKPINIYYHTYSASKKASLVALHKVYDWALTQSVNPIFVSEYVALAHEFSRMVVAQSHGGWTIHNLERATEIRVPQTSGYPDLEASRGVLGYADHGDDRYVHLDPTHSPFLVMTQHRPTQPFLASTNGEVTKWHRTHIGLELTLKGHGPITGVLGNVKSCKLLQGPSLTQRRLTRSNLRIDIGKGSDNSAALTCQ